VFPRVKEVYGGRRVGKEEEGRNGKCVSPRGYGDATSVISR